MDIKITPYNGEQQGYLCMPLYKNAPEPKNTEWILTNCPKCGAKCWESKEARELKAKTEMIGLCTNCALKAGVKEA